MISTERGIREHMYLIYLDLRFHPCVTSSCFLQFTMPEYSTPKSPLHHMQYQRGNKTFAITKLPTLLANVPLIITHCRHTKKRKEEGNQTLPPKPHPSSVNDSPQLYLLHTCMRHGSCASNASRESGPPSSSPGPSITLNVVCRPALPPDDSQKGTQRCNSLSLLVPLHCTRCHLRASAQVWRRAD
jgi:hypothetical protein